MKDILKEGKLVEWRSVRKTSELDKRGRLLVREAEGYESWRKKFGELMRRMAQEEWVLER